MTVPSFEALPSYQQLALGEEAMGTNPGWPARIWAEATAPRTLAQSQDAATQRRVAKLSSSGGSSGIAEATLPTPTGTATMPKSGGGATAVAQWYAHIQNLAGMGLIHSIPSLLRTPHTPLTQVEELDPDMEAMLVHFAEWLKRRE